MNVIAAFLLLAATVVDHRPETWFHVIGGNASREGLTADLEAITGAGYGGIQFFHGQVGKAETWPGVAEQIPCLSEKWDGLVRHAADECRRLGLSFRVQNCPGWSMSGGPWIAPSNAMRKLVFVRKDVTTGRVPDILDVPKTYGGEARDWWDVAYLAFPTPLDDDGTDLRPTEESLDGNVRTLRFATPVTVRSMTLPSPVELHHDTCYNPGTHVRLFAVSGGRTNLVLETDYSMGCWQDWTPFTLACNETTADCLRVELSAAHPLKFRYVRLSSAARLDNWEGLSGACLRGFARRAPVRRAPSTAIGSETVRVVKPGEALGAGRWTVLRLGHVNTLKKNGPAPAEATGYECDKLDPRGIEANFAGYVGRLAQGPLAGGRLRGMIVDSWECERQSWTPRMRDFFRTANGFDPLPMLPALFGWIVGDEARTEAFLRVWRKTVSDLVTRNYYGRMAELAHAAGLDVSYETSFGDVLPGDPMAYWKYCDTPMCEFWQPYGPGVGHPNFKPVKSCVSAAHLYGKRRVAAEAFTNTRLTWDENFRDLKEQAVRHFARGVTHLVTHTYTHNPQLGLAGPGTSFGDRIGTPFLRQQTWWSFMPSFTRWMAECGEFLERGRPVVDVLRYVGDDYGHRPDECEAFPVGFACDYLNADVLFTRLRVSDGRLALPDGLSYERLWISGGTYLSVETERRLSDLVRQGAVVVRGSTEEAVRGLKPQVSGGGENVLWYHRREGTKDLYFVAAETNGFRGTLAFRTQTGVKTLSLNLAAAESRLLTFPGAVGDCPEPATEEVSLSPWTLTFPGEKPIRLTGLVAWKDLPSASEDVRSFSGTARYETTFSAPAEGAAVSIDLGEVRDFARILVNGTQVAECWAKPYRCKVSSGIRKGENRLTVEVTSTWFNRLVQEYARPPEERRIWTVWDIPRETPPCLRPGAALRPSGLLGSVRVRVEERRRSVN